MSLVSKVKQWIVILAIGGVFMAAPSFANELPAAEQALKTFSELATWLINLASWLWVVLAMLAGKLMTNSMIYGEFIGLDVYLWKIWNISKNFANFAL